MKQALQTLQFQALLLEDNGFDVEPIWRAINHTVWRARFAPLVDKNPESFSETFRRQIASAAGVSGVHQLQLNGRARVCFDVRSELEYFVRFHEVPIKTTSPKAGRRVEIRT